MPSLSQRLAKQVCRTLLGPGFGRGLSKQRLWPERRALRTRLLPAYVIAALTAFGFGIGLLVEELQEFVPAVPDRVSGVPCVLSVVLLLALLFAQEEFHVRETPRTQRFVWGGCGLLLYAGVSAILVSLLPAILSDTLPPWALVLRFILAILGSTAVWLFVSLRRAGLFGPEPFLYAVRWPDREPKDRTELFGSSDEATAMYAESGSHMRLWPDIDAESEPYRRFWAEKSGEPVLLWKAIEQDYSPFTETRWSPGALRVAARELGRTVPRILEQFRLTSPEGTEAMEEFQDLWNNVNGGDLTAGVWDYEDTVAFDARFGARPPAWEVLELPGEPEELWLLPLGVPNGGDFIYYRNSEEDHSSEEDAEEDEEDEEQEYNIFEFHWNETVYEPEGHQEGRPNRLGVPPASRVYGCGDTRTIWHSNSDALLESTDLNLRWHHLTIGAVGRRADTNQPEGSEHPGRLFELLYMDVEPQIGLFNRVRHVADELAERERTRLYYAFRSCGGWTGIHAAEPNDVVGVMMALTKYFIRAEVNTGDECGHRRSVLVESPPNGPPLDVDLGARVLEREGFEVVAQSHYSLVVVDRRRWHM